MKVSEKIGRSLDNALGIFSPEWAAKRSRARFGTQGMQRYYEAATKGRRADGWNPMDGGPKEGLIGLKDLRDRARDFSRNNGYARKAVGGIVSNTIGTGIVCQFKSAEANKKRALDRGQLFWNSWANSIGCDHEGQDTFYALQALVFRTMIESGEVLIRKRVMNKAYFNQTGKCPLQLQVLEPEFLDHSKDNGSLYGNNNRIISGIEYDAQGKRVAYHIYRGHPAISTTTLSDRIPENEIIHLFKKERQGQVRGIPTGVSVHLNLRDLDLYEDAELVRRKIAACFAGFVTEGEDEGQGINGQVDERPELIDKFQPGMLERLGPGESITFATPPNVTGYAEYATSMLHKVSAGYEVPYSVLTGDYSQVNFSSGRMGWLEFQRLIDQYRWLLFVPRYLDRVLEWFKETAELVSVPFTGLEHEWTAPKREMIDPLKEIQATLLSVKGGLISMPEAIREAGYDHIQTANEIEAWNKLLDQKKIVLDSDPRADAKRLLAQATAEATASREKASAEKVATDAKVE